MSCPICLKTLTSPTFKLCTAFCATCLANYINTNIGHCPCPACGEEIDKYIIDNFKKIFYGDNKKRKFHEDIIDPPNKLNNLLDDLINNLSLNNSSNKNHLMNCDLKLNFVEAKQALILLSKIFNTPDGWSLINSIKKIDGNYNRQHLKLTPFDILNLITKLSNNIAILNHGLYNPIENIQIMKITIQEIINK
jgi:hypothetical protein